MKNKEIQQYTFSYLTDDGSVKQKFFTNVSQEAAYLDAKHYFKMCNLDEFWYGW